MFGHFSTLWNKGLMIKIACIELFEAIFGQWRSKYSSKITVKIFLSSLSYKNGLQSLLGKSLHLLGKECIVS